MIKKSQKSKYKYSLSYIEENADKINWKAVTIFTNVEKLPRHFFEKFIDQWDWEIISEFQTLSKEFLQRYSEYINWEKYHKFHDGQ